MRRSTEATGVTQHPLLGSRKPGSIDRRVLFITSTSGHSQRRGGPVSVDVAPGDKATGIIMGLVGGQLKWEHALVFASQGSFTVPAADRFSASQAMRIYLKGGRSRRTSSSESRGAIRVAPQVSQLQYPGTASACPSETRLPTMNAEAHSPRGAAFWRAEEPSPGLRLLHRRRHGKGSPGSCS